MKVLLLYDYPPSPGGLATQGDLLYRGLLEMGVDAQAVHFESAQEKEWQRPARCRRDKEQSRQKQAWQRTQQRNEGYAFTSSPVQGGRQHE